MSYYHLVLSATGDGVTGNPLIASFTYLTSEVSPSNEGAGDLADAFKELMLSDEAYLAAAVTSGTEFNSIVVKAPQVPTVLHVDAFTVAGSRSGETMPRFVAWQFRSPRSVGNIREGKKRFGLVSESDVINGVPVAGMTAVLNDLAGALGTTFVVDVGGISTSMTPIIVKRIAYEAPSGRTAYRLPEGLDPFAYAIADDWSFQNVTTQSSRKT